MNSIDRILMLVPHEPDEDPRIKWAASLCSKVAFTEIIGLKWIPDAKPAREYNGNVYTERIYASEYVPYSWSLLNRFGLLGLRRLVRVLATPSPLRIILSKSFRCFLATASLVFRVIPLGDKAHARFQQSMEDIKARVLERLPGRAVPTTSAGSKPPEASGSMACGNNDAAESGKALSSGASRDGSNGGNHCDRESTNASHGTSGVGEKRGMFDTLSGTVRSVFNLLLYLRACAVIPRALYRRARSVSITPRLIICHDIYSLPAGARLKKSFHCPLIYDCHEFWPEANLQASRMETTITKWIEGFLIRYADAVITVTPQLASHLSSLYKIRNVLVAPNAEPFEQQHKPSCERPVTFPIRLLIQGRVGEGRGIEEFLQAWSRIEDTRAVLIMRCPENEYLGYLRSKFRSQVDAGRIVIVPPVPESELTAAACEADMGVITYSGPSKNHIFACPNKLSQYLQAGLAILHHSDQQFVSDLVSTSQCGMSFNTENPDCLIRAVLYVVEHPERLQEMKCNAFKIARSTFNWEVQSADYLNTIELLAKLPKEKS